METISFACPHCHQLMALDVKLLGRSVRCPHCRQVIQAPSAPQAPPAAPAAAAPQWPTSPPAFSPPPPVAPPTFSPAASAPPTNFAPVAPTTAPEFQPPVGYQPPTAPPPVTFQPPPVVVQPPPPPEPSLTNLDETFLPELSLPEPPKESHESIFGEVVDEDLFGTKQPAPVMPSVTPPQPQPAYTPPAAPPVVQQPVYTPPPPQQPAPVYSPPPQQPPAYAPPMQSTAAFTPMPENPAPVYQPVPQQPVYAPPPQQAAPPYSPPPVQPTFTPLPQQPAPTYAPAPRQAAPPPNQPAPVELNPWSTPAANEPALDDVGLQLGDPTASAPPPPAPAPRASRTPAAKAPAKSSGGGGGGNFAVLILLAVYAIAATGAAVYGLLLKPEPEAPHPFRALPDVQGAFDEAVRKKVSEHKGWPSPLEPIPATLITKMNTPFTINQLQITPINIVVQKKVPIQTASTKQPRSTTTNALVMTVKLKNTSNDLTFRPVDPMLFRAATDNSDVNSRPYSGLQAGKLRVYGLLPWSESRDRLVVASEQDNDAPLGPGEEREYKIYSPLGRGDDSTIRGNTQAVWRLHLRSGLTEYDGKERGVTSVVGVSFNPNTDVKWN